MKEVTVAPSDRAIPEVFHALAYEAPFLIEKLLKDQIVENGSEAEALFTEVKRYLVLVKTHPTSLWEMHSLRVDEVWHQFILYTREYMAFCNRFFGAYIPHSPSNAPKTESIERTRVSTFQEFRDRYKEMYGLELPEVWFDEKNVTLQRRILNANAGATIVQHGDGMVSLVNTAGVAMVCVNEIASDALTFISKTGTFYVRELPGSLTDEEKVNLISTLVEYRVLRVAS